ncbi:hypothetical protein AB0I54_47645 [Streptomyces sp. NPDC050625]|uniref:hypothetical protein n=1 Tax=Streptomyces sp. NPDC050625 TaxID=3154629 RepID=UPI0034239670
MTPSSTGGLAIDSTAYIAEMLTDPTAHGIDPDRIAVLYIAIGSEWPETRLLVYVGKHGYQNPRARRFSSSAR